MSRQAKQKLLGELILSTLLVGTGSFYGMTPAYATSAPPDATETVTTSNTIDDPYKSITVSSSSGEVSRGISNNTTSDLTVYLADDFTELKSTNINTYDIAEASGIFTNKKDLNLVGKQVTITVAAATATGSNDGYAYAYGVQSRSGEIVLGDNAKIKVTATTNKQNSYCEAAGIYTGSGLNTVGNNAVINVTAEGTTAKNEVSAYGADAVSGKNLFTGNVFITVKATTVPDGSPFHAFSLYAEQNLQLGIVKFVQSVGLNDLSAAGKTKTIEGDVYAGRDGKNILVLDTAGSYLQGNIYNQKLNSGKLLGVNNITVTNGAVWRPVFDNRYGTDCVEADDDNAQTINVAANKVAERQVAYDSAYKNGTVMALNNGGIIDLTWDGWQKDGTYIADRSYRSSENNHFRSLTVDNLSGAGGILKIDSDLANNRADTLTIGSASTAASLKVQVNYDDFYADSVKGDSVTGKALVVTDNSSGTTLASVTGTKSEYNEKTYEVTVEKDADNTNQWNLVKIEDVTEPTPTPSNITENTKHAADSRDNVNNIWEIETNSLVKRLGDLRSLGKDTDKHDNMWAKYGHGNQKLGEGRDTELNYNQFQLGYDKGFERKDGKMYRGVMVSRINGDADYERGSGDTNSTTLGLYQTWLGNKGHYYDVTFRYGKIDTDYHVTDLSDNYSTGDYDMWATTLSGEYGYRKDFGRGAYFEPSAELILGHIGSADYTTSKNMDVYLDATKHAVTRLGFLAGKDFGRGDAYFKANYFHDFAGDGSVTTGSVTYENDQPKNWWELGIGGDVKMGKNASAYAEVRKLFGDLKSNVNFSIGARWSF